MPGDLPGKLPGNQQGEGGITDLDDLRQKWSALEQRWVGYLAIPDARIAGRSRVQEKTSSLGSGSALAEAMSCSTSAPMPTTRRRRS